MSGSRKNGFLNNESSAWTRRPLLTGPEEAQAFLSQLGKGGAVEGRTGGSGLAGAEPVGSISSMCAGISSDDIATVGLSDNACAVENGI